MGFVYTGPRHISSLLFRNDHLRTYFRVNIKVGLADGTEQCLSELLPFSLENFSAQTLKFMKVIFTYKLI